MKGEMKRENASIALVLMLFLLMQLGSLPLVRALSEPPDGDAWTESLNNWTADMGSIQLNTYNQKVGTYYIWAISEYAGESSIYRAVFRRSIPQLDLTTWQTLKFWCTTNSLGHLSIANVRLLAPDTNNYFEAVISTEFVSGWQLIELSLDNGWTETGNPSKSNIQGIQFHIEFEAAFTWGFGVDGLHFYSEQQPVCAMKTRTDGYFYIPSIASGLLRILILFDDSNVTGDQRGYVGEIFQLPDGKVDIFDLTFVTSQYDAEEGDENWDYMADVRPDGEINIYDVCAVTANYGRSGTYSVDLAGVTITFDTGEEETAESGFVTIPEDATNFTVKQNGNPIGAMIIFYNTG